MTDFGPLTDRVAAFIEDLQGLNDGALWQLEERIARNVASVPLDSGRAWRSRPETRELAEATGRLLAWYEAGHYARLAVEPRDDDTVEVDLPGEGTTVSLPNLARLAPLVAQALVVRDQLTTNAFLEAIAGWPDFVDGYRAERLDGVMGLPRCFTKASGETRFAPESVAEWLEPPPTDLVFVVVDILAFKPVNDRIGRDAGDAYLRTVAERLSDAVDPWVAFRMAGDQYLAAARLPDAEVIRSFAARIRSVVEQPNDGESVALAIGAARFGPDLDLFGLLIGADHALFIAKQLGGPEGEPVYLAESDEVSRLLSRSG